MSSYRTPLLSDSRREGRGGEEDEEEGEEQQQQQQRSKATSTCYYNVHDNDGMESNEIASINEAGYNSPTDTDAESMDPARTASASSALINSTVQPVNAKDFRKAAFKHNFYITVPWSPQLYFSVRGAENVHIYLWIAKDLAWTQYNYNLALTFGIAAMSWCLVLAYHAFASRCYIEVYMLAAVMLWLAGNFNWMYGEIVNNDDDGVRPNSSYMMTAGIIWMLLYYIVWRPLKIFNSDEHNNSRYEDVGLHSRFKYFENWRQYEHIHTLCWLCKDVAWITGNKYMWCVFLVPTVAIGVDFIYTVHKTKRMTIDLVHYIAQLMWVFGNMAWAIGELFGVPGYGSDDADSIYYIFNVYSPKAVHRCRWYASWILFAAYFPIVLLYFVWVPLTCTGRIVSGTEDELQQQQQQQQQHHKVREEDSRAAGVAIDAEIEAEEGTKEGQNVDDHTTSTGEYVHIFNNADNVNGDGAAMARKHQTGANVK